LASLTLTPGSKVTTGAPILHKKEEIKAFLQALRDAADDATGVIPGDIATKPVLVRADKVYYLNDSDEVEYFHSIVGESHDFAVNHNVATKRDPANPVVYPGPYGAGGCNDCHGPNNSFFYGKQLAEPAQYDYLDEHGIVPNPDAGKPLYSNHYEHMGYSALRAGELTATIVPVTVVVSGANGSVSYLGVDCDQTSGSCKAGADPGSTVTFTATPGANTAVTWQGCTPGADPNSCTADVGTPTTGVNNIGILVRASFASTASYTITASAGTGGSITPAGATTVSGGLNQAYTITPDAGYVISNVVVDGVSKGAVSSYTFGAVSTNHTIAASFVNQYTITAGVASAASTGTISPAGATAVTASGSQTFTFTPAAGYRIKYVAVNGAAVAYDTVNSQYTFTNVKRNSTISVYY
jgi:hypothetical protein